MEAVNVKRDNLIAKIEANRAKHLRTYEVAIKAWRQKLADALRKYANRISEARSKVLRGKDLPPIPAPHLPKPTKFLAEYDRVLGMLRMSVEQIVKLDASDYDRYILDKWDWSEMFANSTVSYARNAKLAELPVRRKRR